MEAVVVSAAVVVVVVVFVVVVVVFVAAAVVEKARFPQFLVSKMAEVRQVSLRMGWNPFSQNKKLNLRSFKRI